MLSHYIEQNKETKPFFYFLILYLLSAPLSYHLMPYMGFYGADLSMQYTFHRCAILKMDGSNLFELTGPLCQNNNSHYAYPVFIFRFFTFTKLFNSFESFYLFWTALTALILIISPFFWLKKIKSQLLLVAVGFLTVLQAPSFYAFERGGTDITFVAMWTLAAFAMIRSQWFIAGVFMAIAAFFKLYPALAICPILLGMMISKDWKPFLKTCSGIILTMIVVFASDIELWKHFLLVVLPKEMIHNIGTNPIGHSLIGPYPKWFVYLLMLIVWVVVAQLYKTLKKNQDPFFYIKLSMAASLGLSTYFSGHSFDYNLITLFPLIYMLSLYFLESPFNKKYAICLFLMILTTLGPSNVIFMFSKYAIRIKILMPVILFVLCGFEMIKVHKPKWRFKDLFNLRRIFIND